MAKKKKKLRVYKADHIQNSIANKNLLVIAEDEVDARRQLLKQFGNGTVKAKRLKVKKRGVITDFSSLETNEKN